MTDDIQKTGPSGTHNNFTTAPVGNTAALITVIILLIVSAGISLVGLAAAIDRTIFLGKDGYYFVKHLQEGLESYFSKHKRYPEPSAWCDVLKQDEASSDYFWYDSECEFAINRHLAELEGPVPADMVVLYQAEPGWNRAGGPELVRGYRGSVYSRVLTGEGNFKTIHIADAPYLRWKPQDSGIIPAVDRTKPCAVLAGGVVFCAMVVLIFLRKQLMAYPLLTLGLAILSGGAGMFWGSGSEWLYSLIESKHLGQLAGGAAGLLAGLCFVPVLGKWAEYTGLRAGLICFGVLTGTLFGLLCSCAVHGFLMIAYRVPDFVNMAAGCAFGAWTGGILGWIPAAVIKRRLQRQQGQVKTTEVRTAAPAVSQLDSSRAIE